ncbi:hypothetical protein GCM10023193_50590 [Planotetraspora kaengkrachanensis]|uniref:Uncharacterized protein n=2 Tax=Planotetraspora kaengkrachanensis TaxID=575193 RepID=A0A8J3M039_9ACTN|nr:hypothetical protein Pka01_27450 [Planotetraspora kaengkrachanensis]
MTVETPEFCAVKIGTLHLGTIRVEDYQPPTWPSHDRSQQIHLDLTVDDLDTAEHEAVRLGMLPDLALLRAGLIEAGRLHPLVATALLPGHSPDAKPHGHQSENGPRMVVRGAGGHGDDRRCPLAPTAPADGSRHEFFMFWKRAIDIERADSMIGANRFE